MSDEAISFIECPRCHKHAANAITGECWYCPEIPEPGQWPCQTEVPSDALVRAMPPRLVPFLYRLLLNYPPGAIEHHALEVRDSSLEIVYTNWHIRDYATALAVFLLHRDDSPVVGAEVPRWTMAEIENAYMGSGGLAWPHLRQRLHTLRLNKLKNVGMRAADLAPGMEKAP